MANNPASPAAVSDTATAIAMAALSLCDNSTNSSLRGEIRERIQIVMDVLEHLEEITCEAAFHRFDLSLQNLSSTIRMVSRELKMINALHENDLLKDSTQEVEE